jgi:hypothetical protein
MILILDFVLNTYSTVIAIPMPSTSIMQNTTKYIYCNTAAITAHATCRQIPHLNIYVYNTDIKMFEYSYTPPDDFTNNKQNQSTLK